MRLRSLLAALAALSCLSTAVAPRVAAAAPDVSTLRLPPGFGIEVWAEGVTNARSLARGARGTLFVGTRSAGNVYAVTDQGGTRRVVTIARGLTMPNGVAFHDGALYVGELTRVLRYDDIESRLGSPPEPVVVAQLPPERHHGWRYIAFGPDGKLYVSIGAPCNVCDRDGEGYGQILRMNPDGSAREVVARGVRNSVGFAWHPRTRQLWFTDNGRDMLGDDVPPCELNRLTRAGQHFGFPFCHAGDLADPEFGSAGRCGDAVPPVLKLGPHVAPLGMRFYEGRQFPADMRGSLFIAEHGSWNRSEKIGYRVMRVRLDGERAVGYEEFAGGWLRPDGSVTGRPVDLLVLDDGSMLVSDDVAGVVYRITHRSAR
jgi:glucose/arabinose dehydrogenase